MKFFMAGGRRLHVEPGACSFTSSGERGSGSLEGYLSYDG
jgi:hypothetical protein